VLTAASAFLRDPAAPVPDWLIRIGLPPVAACVEAWAARCPETLLLAQTPFWTDPLRSARTVLLGDPAASLSVLAAAAMRAGLRAAEWNWLDECETAARESLAALRPRLAEAELVQAISAAAADETPVFIGSSLVVRDFDGFLARRRAPLSLYANRGVSGIDGNLSTAAGVVAGAGQPGFAVLGDVALFHDLNALSLCRNRPLVLVVVNNGGGAIFGQLPQSGLPEFAQLWLTPTGLDLARAAALFELEYARLAPGSDMAGTLAGALQEGRPVLFELQVDRHASHAARAAWWSSCGASDQGR
jgi:2-succinyl-5-enolpyruvyl-6-hydroxy-3-cyclohexene-1-carboxylate synthase